MSLNDPREMWSRRRFLDRLALAGAAGLLGLQPEHAAAAEAPPETKRLRLGRFPYDVACVAPIWVMEDLLRAEGFTDIQYVLSTTPPGVDVAEGRLDFGIGDVIGHLLQLDAGRPLVALGGIHAGCFELFGTDRIRSIRDLKGKTVAVADPGRQAFVAAMAAYVGLDPRRDINFLTISGADGIRRLAEGKVDAFLGFPPEPQELRVKKIGHSLVNTGLDRPWSQYFCCLAHSNQEFVRKNPVATKRALRALLKATEICGSEPERAARFIVERNYVKNAEYVAQTLKEIPYSRWRDYDSADTLRFYALRLHESGGIKTSPNKLIADGTDWRFVNELKKELKT